MPNVVITLTMSEANAARAQKALCHLGGFTGEEVNAANAKRVVREWIVGVVENEARTRTAFNALEIT